MSTVLIKTDSPEPFYRTDKRSRAERAREWIEQARGKTLRELYEERTERAMAHLGRETSPQSSDSDTK